MAKANGQDTATAQVLAVGLGRGFGGKSTGLAELVWRARNQGREVIVADGDPRSRTLAGMFPEAMSPPTEELRGDNQDGFERRSGWMSPGSAGGRA